MLAEVARVSNSTARATNSRFMRGAITPDNPLKKATTAAGPRPRLVHISSELQRVAQRLVDALCEPPRVVDYLKRTAPKCRDSATFIAGMTSNPNARMAANQLDEAARRCHEVAHYASLPPQRVG